MAYESRQHLAIYGTDPEELPAWVSDLHPHQKQAVVEVVNAFVDGADVVMLDGPTGTGKTLIAECVRRLMGVGATYVCSDKGLQDQFVRDFPYAKVLKGRNNYPTLYFPISRVSCADCDYREGRCSWCHDQAATCPYNVAKGEAKDSALSVLNTSYLLHEANTAGDFSNLGLVVIDEADTLERSLMGFVEYAVSQQTLDELNLEPPIKGAHKPTIKLWLENRLLPEARKMLKMLRAQGVSVSVVRQRTKYARLVYQTIKVIKTIDDDNWIRDNNAGPLVMKPVKVADQAWDVLWKHGDQFLCMSATLISTDEMIDSLGLRDLNVATVEVPMTFPKDSRPIYVAGVANVIRKDMDVAVARIKLAISNICERHPEDNILVHTVSYKLADDLMHGVYPHHDPISYPRAAFRDAAVRAFISPSFVPRILFAPSAERGIDLKGDACRVVIVAKVPFLYLGDSQVSARTHLPGGQVWYVVQAIRTLVQMTGRANRSADDYCSIYILDAQFTTNIWKRYRHLLPKWWREAVNQSININKLR